MIIHVDSIDHLKHHHIVTFLWVFNWFLNTLLILGVNAIFISRLISLILACISNKDLFFAFNIFLDSIYLLFLIVDVSEPNLTDKGLEFNFLII
jgi:hypothetical protein